jgi:ABC-type branched-subunit amino acid transport system substrate-binding protein
MRRRSALVILPFVLTACGSTVQYRGTQAVGDGLSPLPGQSSTGGTTGTGTTGTTGAVTPGGTGATGGSTGGSTGGATSGITTPAGSTTGGAQVPQGTLLRAGKGYTAKEIRIGFSTSNDAGRALGGLGLGVQIADQNQLVNTWLTKVNAEGGIAGRKVVPVFFDYKATGDTPTQDQAACSTWTQDTRVFAATGIRAGTTGTGDNLTPCLAKAGVPWLAASGDVHKWQQYLAAMYSTGDMNATREERVLVESLAAQGFFAPKDKVGIIINNGQDDMGRAVKEGMEPALAKLGLSLTRKIVISNAQSESNSAELQMFAAGVTNVLFAAPGGAAASQFMIAAESQGRTYKYGISSQDSPGLTVQALAPANQAKHAVGYGYQPGLDVDANNQPTETPAMKTCFNYYRSKGFDTGSLNRAAMSMICDATTLVKVALKGQVNPTQGSFGQGVAVLGTRLPVASTFTSDFNANQHDGIGSYRFLGYEAGCSCFRYSGGVRPA